MPKVNDTNSHLRCISTPRVRRCWHSCLGKDTVTQISFVFWYRFSFGSKVIGNRTGIIFNNEMDDFSTPGTPNAFGLPASEANYISTNDKHVTYILSMVCFAQPMSWYFRKTNYLHLFLHRTWKKATIQYESSNSSG